MVALASLDRAESGRDQVSLHLALLAMTNNIGYAVAVGIVNGLLQLFHYQAGAPEGNATWAVLGLGLVLRSEEHTSELQSLMRISYAAFCLKTQHTALNAQEHQTNGDENTQIHNNELETTQSTTILT